MSEKNEFNDGLNSEVRLPETEKQDAALDPIYGHETPSTKGVQQRMDQPLLGSKDIEHLANHLCEVIVQAIAKQTQVFSPQYRKGSNEFENKVIWYLDNLLNGITEKKDSTGQRYYSISKLLPNQDNTKEKLDTVIQNIQSLQQTIVDLNKVIDKQALIIKKQHERIIQYENDVIYKTQKDLIMELIGIADQLRYTLNDYADEKEFDSLYKSIGDLSEWVDGSLQAVGVRKSVNIDDKFDRKRQEIVETQETEDPNQEGKIVSILPGYIWAIPMIGSNEMQDVDSPKAYEFMIRPEQVARLRYVKPKGNSAQLEQKEQIMESSHDEDNCTIVTPTEGTADVHEHEIQSSDNIDKQKEEKKSSSWKIW